MDNVEEIEDHDDRQMSGPASEGPEPCDIDDGPDEMVSDMKRTRRRPVWSKDYVFCFRNKMAETKNTPRKLICPVCKDHLKPDEKFEDHVVACTKSRFPCSECGQTFKKKLYLLKHVQAQHKTGSKSPAQSTSKADEKEEWLDNEPDISLGEDEDESETETDKSQNLLLGRLVRKRTQPEVPHAPKKKKTETVSKVPEMTTTVVENDSRDDNQFVVDEDRVGEETPEDPVGTGQSKAAQKSQDKRAIEVKCARRDSEVSSRRDIAVVEEGEEIYRNSVVARKLNKGPMKISLEDLLPAGNVRTSDMELTLCEDGEVLLKFDYQSDN